VTSLTLVRRIAARPSIVFDMLVTPDGIAAWWGPDDGPVLIAETDLRVGGRFRVRFRMLDGTEHESRGEYLEVVAPTRLAMTWRWTDGMEDPGESRLEFDLSPTAEGTELTLTHALLNDEASRQSHEAGWSGSLDKLVRRLATRGSAVS
jgi:uncharacterized protein YndB with AHSA1/START domain